MLRLALTILAALSAALALEAAPGWENVQQLVPNQHIIVTETDGTRTLGAFLTATDSALTLRAGPAAHSIERTRIGKVETPAPARRLRRAAIWGGIGLAVGITIDQTLGVRLRNEGTDANRAITILAPAAILGGIGAALPGYRTVYKRPR
jgi:hypothetical protein